MPKHQFPALSLMVENEFGALTRVTSLIRRRGYNIESLVVAETMDPTISRITLMLQCEMERLPQIVEQLRKNVNVISAEIYSDDAFISRELIMVRIRIHEKFHEIARIADRFHAHLIEGTDDTLTLELSDTPQNTHDLIDALSGYDVVDLSRTGIVAIDRMDTAVNDSFAT